MKTGWKIFTGFPAPGKIILLTEYIIVDRPVEHLPHLLVAFRMAAQDPHQLGEYGFQIHVISLQKTELLLK